MASEFTEFLKQLLPTEKEVLFGVSRGNIAIPQEPLSFEKKLPQPTTEFVNTDVEKEYIATLIPHVNDFMSSTNMVSNTPTTPDVFAKPQPQFKDLDIGDISPLEQQIITHEGIRNKVYIDTQGHPTVGVGFNLDRGDARDKIESLGLDYDAVRSGTQRLNDQQIISLLRQDIIQAIQAAKTFAGDAWESLSDTRKRILTDMAFNLGGTRLSKFNRLRKAIQEGNWELAYKSMKESLWYKQTKSRGKRLAQAMLTDMINIG